jgi:hypothetical protein
MILKKKKKKKNEKMKIKKRVLVISILGYPGLHPTDLQG